MNAKMKSRAIENTGKRVQLYYNKDTDIWTARTNIRGLKIDMTVEGITGAPFYPGLPYTIEVT